MVASSFLPPLLITFDDAYAETAIHAFPTLHRYGFGAVVFAVTGQLGGTNTWDRQEPGAQSAPLMTTEDIRRWSRDGIDFGAHTRTHPSLTSLSRCEIEDEIRGSKHDLETLLDANVDCFAYPYGLHNDAAVDVATQTYRLAFTTAEGVNGLTTPCHSYRRTAPAAQDTRLDLAWRVRTGTLPLTGPRSVLRIRSRTRALAQLERVIRLPQVSGRGGASSSSSATRAQLPATVVHVLGPASVAGTAQARITTSLAQRLDRDRYRLGRLVHRSRWTVGDRFRCGGSLDTLPAVPGDQGRWRNSSRMRALCADRPAIIHLHVGGRSLASLVHAASSARVVAHLHATHGEDGRPLPLEPFARSADAVIATCAHVAGAVTAPATVVYPSVEGWDTSVGQASSEGRLMVGTAGRLEPVKGHAHLLRAIRLMRDRGIDAQAEIAGSGAVRQRYGRSQGGLDS